MNAGSSTSFSKLIAGLALCAAMIVSAVTAQSLNPPEFEVQWDTHDGGGGIASGGVYALSGTVGQADTELMTGGDFEFAAGFWPGMGPICAADINGDGLKNVQDLLIIIQGWGPCPGQCPPACQADITQDCNVNVSDLIALISGWGVCD